MTGFEYDILELYRCQQAVLVQVIPYTCLLS